MNSQYTYKVYDHATNKVVLENVNSEKVCELVGVTAGHLGQYADKGILYKRRYLITRTSIDETEKILSSKDRAGMAAWEDMRKAVDVLKNGGHIVKKGRKKYVQP
jgi:hypothetical protein